MENKRLIAVTALICVIALMAGCSSSSSAPAGSSAAQTSSSAAESSEKNESIDITSNFGVSSAAVSDTEVNSLDEESGGRKAEKTSYQAIPNDAFRFSSSSYADSDFLWYVYSNGYAGSSQNAAVYRYDDYLVLIVSHYIINKGSYKETRVLTQTEGESFLSKETGYTEKERQTDTSKTPAVGGISEYAQLRLDGIDRAIEIEPLDLSSIDFELPPVNSVGSLFDYDYPEERWAEVFAGDEDSTKEYSQKFGQFAGTDKVFVSGAVSGGPECVLNQIEDITGEKVEKAKFVEISDDISTIEATLKNGVTYTVKFNYQDLVLDIS